MNQVMRIWKLRGPSSRKVISVKYSKSVEQGLDLSTARFHDLERQKSDLSRNKTTF
jgi:hypothetical protein